MAVDLSKNVFELFSGRKRTRLLPTLAIALIVTGAVAIPLTLRAVDRRNNPVEEPVVLAPGDAQQIMVDTADSDLRPLDQAEVAGSILISLRDDTADAVSFSLYAAGADDPIVDSQDLNGPQFDLIVSQSGGGSPFDTTLLRDGGYELFVTIRGPGEDRRTAVSFQVANP